MKDFRCCFILALFGNYFFFKVTQRHPSVIPSYGSLQLNVTHLWMASLLFGLNYKFMNWSYGFSSG